MIPSFNFVIRESTAVILFLGPPIIKLAHRRTVSERIGATEDFIDMAYNEIYNEEYEDFISEGDLDKVLSELGLYVHRYLTSTWVPSLMMFNKQREGSAAGAS